MKHDWPRCLTNGRHTPGSDWERECPLNPENVKRRAERSRKAARSRWRHSETPTSIREGQ